MEVRVVSLFLDLISLSQQAGYIRIAHRSSYRRCQSVLGTERNRNMIISPKELQWTSCTLSLLSGSILNYSYINHTIDDCVVQSWEPTCELKTPSVTPSHPIFSIGRKFSRRRWTTETWVICIVSKTLPMLSFLPSSAVSAEHLKLHHWNKGGGEPPESCTSHAASRTSATGRENVCKVKEHYKYISEAHKGHTKRSSCQNSGLKVVVSRWRSISDQPKPGRWRGTMQEEFLNIHHCNYQSYIKDREPS